MQETGVRSLSREDPLEKEMATHSSILAQKPHGQRSLEGYSPRGRKELGTTEHSTRLYTYRERHKKQRESQRGRDREEKRCQVLPAVGYACATKTTPEGTVQTRRSSNVQGLQRKPRNQRQIHKYIHK